MFDFILKKLSILKKFLLVNLIVFILIGSGTIIYLKTVQPNLIKKTRFHQLTFHLYPLPYLVSIAEKL